MKKHKHKNDFSDSETCVTSDRRLKDILCVKSNSRFSHLLLGIVGFILYSLAPHEDVHGLHWPVIKACQAAEIHTKKMAPVSRHATVHPLKVKHSVVSPGQLVLWLKSKNYKALEQHLDLVQEKYDKGEINDFQLIAAYRDFYDTDPRLAPRFMEWKKTYPDSYTARLAEGIYYVHIGWKARGTKYINETSNAQIEAMNSANSKAVDDLMQSLQLDQKPLLSYYWLIDVSRHYASRNPFGDLAGYSRHVSNASVQERRNAEHLPVSQRDLIDAANRIAPRNFIARRKYMDVLATRWGHSTREMVAFLHECQLVHLPDDDMRVLEAAVEKDKGWNASMRGDLQSAADHYNIAVGLVGNDEDLLEETGQIYEKLHQYDVAAGYYAKVVKFDPGSAIAWSNLGVCQVHMHDMVDAAQSYRKAAEMGEPIAENEWGKFLWYGTIVPRNREAAIDWFKKSAAQGIAQAKTNLYWSQRQMKTHHFYN